MSTNASFAGAGKQVEVGQIDEALRQAWREEAARATEASESLAARTNVLNLIVHGSSPGEIAQVSEAIEQLGVHHPSRTILLLAEPGGAEAALEAWVNTNVQMLPASDRRLLFEQVTIAARGEAAHHLPGVVDPLLLAELPDFLWWLGEPPFSEPGFTRMVDIVDRLIVDSATFAHVGRGLHELAEMTIIPNGVGISDFAWDRLRPWRELVAQFFDPPEYAASLGTIEEIAITYEPQGSGQPSGLSEGILALGWACSRLGWLVGRAPVQEGPGAFRWQLGAAGRTIQAVLRPEHQDDAVVGLRAVVLTAGGSAPGTFRIYREDDTNLATEVEVPGGPKLDRIMRATVPDENDLLLHALAQFGHDRTYDGALVFAAQHARGQGG
jgi:glucose-6-phosphate dehydrogenase assembly protein OpcA